MTHSGLFFISETGYELQLTTHRWTRPCCDSSHIELEHEINIRLHSWMLCNLSYNEDLHPLYCRSLHSGAALWTRVCPWSGHPAGPPVAHGELPASALRLPPVRLLPGYVGQVFQSTCGQARFTSWTSYLIMCCIKPARVFRFPNITSFWQSHV